MLPDIKDDLETRLILRRRRLSGKGGPIRLDSTERGRLRVEIDVQPEVIIIEDWSKSARLVGSRIRSHQV